MWRLEAWLSQKESMLRRLRAVVCGCGQCGRGVALRDSWMSSVRLSARPTLAVNRRGCSINLNLRMKEGKDCFTHVPISARPFSKHDSFTPEVGMHAVSRFDLPFWLSLYLSLPPSLSLSFPLSLHLLQAPCEVSHRRQSQCTRHRTRLARVSNM